MTLPKKGIKKITIDDRKYGWSVKSVDEGLNLSIVPMERQDNLLSVFLCSQIEQLPDGNERISNLLITKNVLHQIVEIGLEMGWKPLGEKGIMHLRGIDNRIKGKMVPSWVSFPYW